MSSKGIQFINKPQGVESCTLQTAVTAMDGNPEDLWSLDPDSGTANAALSEKEEKGDAPEDLIRMKSFSHSSSNLEIADSIILRKPAVGFMVQEDHDEPGKTISSAMQRGEFKQMSGRKSQWGQYLLNVDMKKVMASGTFKLTLLQLARDGESDTLEFLLKTLSKSQCQRMLNSTTDEEGVTALHLAAKNNHYDVCKQLIEAGASVSIRAGQSRATPLHFAVRIRPKKRPLIPIVEEVDGDNTYQVISAPQSCFDRETSVIFLLHEKGANVNDADVEGQTPLHCATIKGNMPCVEQLLQCKSVNVDMKDGQGMTALHLAAAHGYKEIVHALIQNGSNLHITDNDLMTPLHFACADGNVDVVRLIVKKARQQNPEQIKEMLRRVDGEKSTALHIAVGKGHVHVVVELLALLGSQDVTQMVSLARSHGDTPLHIAASQGFLEICEKLISCGAVVDARNDSLATPLLLAAHHNNYEIVEFFNQKGSDLETRDKDNLTPLLLVCKQGHLETLSWLIEHGADSSATDKHDKTCLMLAVEEQRTAAVHELLKYDSILRLLDETDKNANCVLHIAAKNGFLPIIKVLLDHGARIDSKNEDEETALHIAARYGQHVTLKELLDHDKTTVNAVDENASTSLHLAAIEGHTKCAMALIGHGANIALRNTRQMTALDCACSRGWESTALTLLQAQSVVNPIKGSRTTPLHEACINGHPQVVKLLLDWRADVTAKLADGRNPLDCAIDQDQVDCVQMILNHDTWKDSLRNAYVDPVTETVVTPARRLIVKMPEMAEFAFTRSIETSQSKWDAKNLEVTLDFEFLDDMYTVTQWLHHDNDSRVKEATGVNGSLLNEEYATADVQYKRKPSMKKGNISLPEDPSSYEAFNDHGRLHGNAITYTEDTNMLRHNHPLMIMVSRKREGLLQHPVVTALLQYKWNKYGGFVYYSSLVFLMTFVILLNCYMLLIPPPYTIDFLRSLANRRFYAEFTDEHLTNYTDPLSCYSNLESGVTYRGYASESVSNLTCIKWSSTSTDEKLYPDAGLEKNYCRNPGRLREKPWCFTNYSEYNPEYNVREDCKVPACPVYVTNVAYPLGTTCHFPFEYKGVTYTTCIGLSNGYFCSITPNFDEDPKGGYCSEADPYCVMPKWRDKKPCGNPNTDQRNCEARGCCYAIQNKGQPTEYSECFQKLSECHDKSDLCPILVKSTGCEESFMSWACPLSCSFCNETKEEGDGMRRRFLYLMSTFPDDTFHPEWSDGCYFCLPGAAKKWGTECRHKGAWEDPVKMILLVLCVFNLLRLLLQIWNYHLEAFKPIFFLEMFLYVLCMLLVIDLNGFDLEFTDEMIHELELYEPLVDMLQKETGLRMNWQWQCGVMALFLSWMNLLLYIQKIPYLGIYVVMFNDIFKTFTKFSIVFLLFILSFAFTFHALLQNEIEFEFPFQSILKATVMMVGELDFTGIFLGGSEEYAKKVNYAILTYILFAIFIVIMMIIIMNLLVGLAVGDIMEVQQHATLERLKMQVELALEVEFAVPNIIRKRFVRKSAVIKPNLYRGRNALTRAIFEDKNLSTKNLASVIATGKSEGEEMQESMQQMMGVTREMRTKINDLEVMVKELLVEAKETKSAVDETANVQQQKIMLDDEAQSTLTHGLRANQRSLSRQSLHSPKPTRSLIPAFMRSASFRSDNRSSGRRQRSSLRRFHFRSSEAISGDGVKDPLLQSMHDDAAEVSPRGTAEVAPPYANFSDSKNEVPSEGSPLSSSRLRFSEIDHEKESEA